MMYNRNSVQVRQGVAHKQRKQPEGDRKNFIRICAEMARLMADEM